MRVLPFRRPPHDEISGLAAVPALFTDERDAMVRKEIELAKRLAEIDAERPRIFEEYRQAASQSWGLALSEKGEVKRLTAELLASADPRLEDFKALLETAQGRLRHCVTLTAFKNRNFLGANETTYESNVKEVEATQEAVAAALAEVEAMQFEALSRAEIDARLGAISQRLTPLLAVFHLPTPQVGEDGGVRFPREIPEMPTVKELEAENVIQRA